MKKLFLIIFVAVATLCISSCGTSRLHSNNNSLQTKVVLDNNNFKVVKTVTGTESATYVFGIGGLANTALRDGAIANLIKNAGMDGKSQALVNTQVAVKVQRITPFYTVKTATATAQVVEFIK